MASSIWIVRKFQIKLIFVYRFAVPNDSAAYSELIGAKPLSDEYATSLNDSLEWIKHNAKKDFLVLKSLNFNIFHPIDILSTVRSNSRRHGTKA